MIRYIALFSLILFCSGLNAHQDRIFQVNENGDIAGLPDKYQPAHINLKSHTITIASNKLKLPPCISKYFSFNKEYTLNASGSWYHKRSSLPPYLHIEIYPENKDHGYSLLFGLDDLNILEVQVITFPKTGQTAFHTVALDKHCQNSIESGYVKK